MFPRIRTFSTIVGLAFCCWGAAVPEMYAQGVTLYVAPNGSDTAPGTERKKPLATLVGARDAIRRMRKSGGLPRGGVTVQVAGGTYVQSAPLELTAEDSGDSASPIVYQAEPGRTVRLTGGRIVTDFKLVTDPKVKERLDPTVRDRVLQADLKAQGITDYGTMTPRGFGRAIQPAGIELFLNDRPLPLARWPNNGFVHVTDVLSVPERQIVSTEITERIRRWTGEPELWTFAYWGYDWADSYTPVSQIDPAKSLLAVGLPASSYGYKKGQRFYLLNALSELDSPGEWYVDRAQGILYLLPSSRLKVDSAVVSVAVSLVTMNNVSYTTLRGFTFEACRGDAIRISGGQDNRVVASTLRNIGNRAVVITGGATNSGVVGCDISETGDGGIVLTGGDRVSLRPAGLYADNNQIHDYSRWDRTYRPGVAIDGVGNRASHNLIYNGPHNAIQLSGNDHIIEFNEIHNVCYETGDVGAFYTGRDWTARGTIIRGNWFHDISGPGHLGAMGIYLDDQASGFTITGNLFQRMTRAVFIGGGDDNVVTNNLFMDCLPSVHLDARGLGWQKAATDDPKDTLRTRYASVPVTGELWRTKYPTLVRSVTEAEAGAPIGNVVERNIALGGRWSDIEPKAKSGITFMNNLTDTADAGFANATKNDFGIKPGSPAATMGFPRIDTRNMGLYKSPDRASWPVSHPIKAPVAVQKPSRPAAPKRNTPAPVVAVPAATKAPTLDGVLAPGEWDTGATSITLEQEVGGEVVTPASRVFVRVAENALWVAFENPVEVGIPLRNGTEWGKDDAIEVALRLLNSSNPASTFVFRGFPGGKLVSSAEAGLSDEAATRAGMAIQYAARIISPSLWTAEMKIPLSTLGITDTKSARLAANFTARKSAGPHWIQWRGTGGSTWMVENAGILTLTPQ
jgi:hypothetical protein